jgi:23S rRNA (cytosine1962-C5)-methyltransferase
LAAVTRSSSIFRPHPIAEAVARRRALAERTDLTAYRLFNGNAEGIPGLAIDRYADVAVIHADSRELLERRLPSIHEDLPDVETAYARIHTKAAATAPSTPLWGAPIDEVEVVESGAHYLVRPPTSGGLFIDMREVRMWLHGSAKGRRVLNLFAYTCSLGVVAALGGAQHVVNLDVSRSYLEWGKTNYELNRLHADDRDFIYGDALDWLGRFARRGTHFDVVIVDPPSFSSTPFSVTRDYPRLVAAAARVMAPAGILLAATNHSGTSDERFETWLRAGLKTADRHGHIVQRWHEPAADFPVAVGRRPYLKVGALVLD